MSLSLRRASLVGDHYSILPFFPNDRRLIFTYVGWSGRRRLTVGVFRNVRGEAD
jgi:hypothetical protein